MSNKKYVTYEEFENPYAFNFYKLEINTSDDFELLNKCVNNAVLSIKVKEPLVADLKLKLAEYSFIDYRIITIADLTLDTTETIQSITATDHITQFKNYIVEQLGQSEILMEELTLLE